jgi:hypothetical protein
MPAFDRFVSATANPMLVTTRLLIGLFLVWVGLAKLIPGWNPLDSDSVSFLGTVTQGKLDGQIGLYLIGGWQIIAGLALCIVPALRLAVILLWLLIALYIGIIAFHLPALLDANHQPTLLASLTLRNALLTFAGAGIASWSVKLTPQNRA